MNTKGATIGAAFLMATSAIGPGFLTQTTVFTVQLGAAFGFVILISLLLDLGAQVNIWRIITGSGQKTPTLANNVLPGLGHFLTALIVLGGLAFNIGNIAGTGLGLNVLLGIDTATGACISAVISAYILANPASGLWIDSFSRTLGMLMILLTAWIVFKANPPFGIALSQTFFPAKIDTSAILTIVGGTVGGYISFAGAHRLLDAGVTDKQKVTNSAYMGIGVAMTMRILLFLAALGIVHTGATLGTDNPPATVFQHAAGALGYRFFGLVMWAAAITSVVGATYTSVSFLTDLWPRSAKYRSVISILFIGLSTGVFLTIGKPIMLLVWAGKINGLILPLALAAMLYIGQNSGIQMSKGWRIAGWIVCFIMFFMVVNTIFAP